MIAVKARWLSRKPGRCHAVKCRKRGQHGGMGLTGLAGFAVCLHNVFHIFQSAVERRGYQPDRVFPGDALTSVGDEQAADCCHFSGLLAHPSSFLRCTELGYLILMKKATGSRCACPRSVGSLSKEQQTLQQPVRLIWFYAFARPATHG